VINSAIQGILLCGDFAMDLAGAKVMGDWEPQYTQELKAKSEADARSARWRPRGMRDGNPRASSGSTVRAAASSPRRSGQGRAGGATGAPVHALRCGQGRRGRPAFLGPFLGR